MLLSELRLEKIEPNTRFGTSSSSAISVTNDVLTLVPRMLELNKRPFRGIVTDVAPYVENIYQFKEPDLPKVEAILGKKLDVYDVPAPKFHSLGLSIDEVSHDSKYPYTISMGRLSRSDDPNAPFVLSKRYKRGIETNAVHACFSWMNSEHSAIKTVDENYLVLVKGLDSCLKLGEYFKVGQDTLDWNKDSYDRKIKENVRK